jgi:hypothetical protein
MFPTFKLQSALEIWKIRYCTSDGYTGCERYKLTQKGHPVPLNLMPSGVLLRRPGDK